MISTTICVGFTPFVGVFCSRDVHLAPELLPMLPTSNIRKYTADIVGQGHQTFTHGHAAKSKWPRAARG